MYRIVIQNGLVVSIESMHHLTSIDGIEGIFVGDGVIEATKYPANFDVDEKGNITRIYNYLHVSVDKPQITADGIDTATITATVDDNTSTEVIELYQLNEDGTETLVASKNAVNGVVTFEITMTQPGILNLIVKSTTKYGQTNVTIKGV
ncbi:hypothetical protein [Tepidibacillus decaturensis]|uniref:Uncharacterized protein n=1 Tax=Tepidibacillus decaturensis TaxID=1413211 RepID=A0A135L1I6_9BACI|nr:hypothetical protein [Tepidibacillus decaturensis]KXG42884.1 hypothetical protein U473_01690 [Tepidibacillus decaturensis]